MWSRTGKVKRGRRKGGEKVGCGWVGCAKGQVLGEVLHEWMFLSRGRILVKVVR